MTRFKASILGNLALAFGLAFLGLMIIAGSMVAGQSVVWWKHGYWEPYSLSSLLLDLQLGVPEAPHLPAIQGIMNFVLSWPATTCLAGIAALCFLIGRLLTKLAERYRPPQR